MFSATMSMLSSDYNVCASVLTNDVYRRYVRPIASHRELLLIGRVMTLLVGMTTLGVALLMAEVGGEDLFRNMVKLFSIATAPVAIPMMAGLLSRRVTNRGALAGFLAGLMVGLFVFFFCPDAFEVLGVECKKENAIVWATTVVTLVMMSLTSWLDQPDPAARQRTDAFLERLSMPIGEDAGDKTANSWSDARQISPFRVVGASTTAIGLMLLAVSPWVGGGLAFGVDVSVGLGLVVAGGLMVALGRLPPADEANYSDRGTP